MYLAIPYLATAIAAGNTAILKPSELSPKSSNAMKMICDKYLDNSCYKVIEGSYKVAEKLGELHWDMILFTGST